MTTPKPAPEGTASQIEIVPVDPADKKLLKAFVDVANELHADDPNWIVPLYMERMDLLTPGKNPYFEHAEAQYWMAKRGGKYVGRITAQIDQLAIKEHGRNEGHFGFFACENNAETAHALISTAENWLRERGMDVAVGPMNLSINEELGLMTEGYDTPSMMLMPHDKAYLKDMLTGEGFEPVINLLAYRRPVNGPEPESIVKLAQRPSNKVQLRKLDMKNYRQEIETLVSIFNEGWHTNWGFVPMTESEVEHMANEMKPIIDPELAGFAYVNGEAAGFIVCLPDVNEMIRDLKGKLLPFGWAKLLWRMKVRGPKQGRVLLMGVRKKYSKGMLGNMIPFKMIYFIKPYMASKTPMEFVEMSWILESNIAMRNMLVKVGGEIYKRYQVFEKKL